MKHKLLLFLTLFFTGLTTFGQSNFEYGYYIDNTGNKKECEVSEITINRFPEKIIIRNNKQIEEVELSGIKEVKYGVNIFQKKEFQYDPSISYQINELSENKDFDLKQKIAFVQLLVEGNYNLYQYIEKGVSTFFYQNPEGDLITLGYKKYFKERNNIAENKFYQTQLFENVKNPKYSSIGSYSILRYNEEDLTRYFKEVNGKSFVKVKQSRLRFNLMLGYSNHTMDINFLSDLPAKKYGHFIMVPEVEYLFNKNLRNPLSIYANVNLQKFKNDFVEKYETGNWNHKVNYQSLYVSLGIKKYFMSSENLSYYGRFGIGLNNPIKSDVFSPSKYSSINPIYLGQFGSGIDAGIGIKLFDSILVEVDYNHVFNAPHINKNTSLNLKAGYSF